MKKIIAVIVLLILGMQFSLGQLKAKLAEGHFENMAYYDAAPMYVELADKFIAKKKGKKEYVYRAAISLGKIFQFEKSNEYFDQLVSVDFQYLSEHDYLMFINQLRMVRQYKQSKNVANTAMSLFPDNSVFQRIATQGSELHKIHQDSVMNDVELLPFNSDKGDFAPFIFRDGIVYTSKSVNKGFLTGRYAWDHGYFTNILEVHKQNDEWGKPQPLSGPFFSRKHDGPVAFNEAESKMVITHNYSSKEKKEGVRYLALYLTNKDEEGEWKPLKKFPHNVMNANTGHGCFSPDGKRLYFASDRSGGEGLTDIYYSDLAYGQWQEPVNIASVNTEGEEMFPYVSKDNKLYFASSGHLGLGGLDIFMMDLNNPAAEPINMGAGINSPADDFGLVADSTLVAGYFSSDRGDFVDRIYSWKKDYPVVELRGKVYVNYDPKEYLQEQEVYLVNRSSGDSTLIKTDEGGAFSSELKLFNEYALTTQKRFFELDEKVRLSTLAVDRDTVIEKDLVLNPTMITINLSVVKASNGNPIPSALVSVLNQKSQKDTMVYADENGHVSLQVKRHRNYWARASKKGFIDGEAGFKTGNYSDKYIELELSLSKIKAGKKFELENIFYDLDEATLREDSRHSLDKLAQFITANDLKIELSAHTDSRGSRMYNQKLSQRRAQSCVDYLIEKGVPSSSIKAQGYGESRLVNHCKDGVECTEGEHQENRRTEVEILEVN